MAARAKLYYLGPSHHCEKARAILAYKGIPFDLVDVPYGNHLAVIRASGQDYVPWVDLQGTTLPPPSAGARGVLWPEIADWAEKTKPDPTLYPGDRSVVRARSRIVESWAHNVVEEMVWRYVVSDVPKAIPDEQARWVFVEMQEKKRGPLEVMALRKEEFLGGVREVCGLSEDLLGEKPYLFGDAPALADFALFGGLHPFKYSGNEIPREFTRLRAWHERVRKLAG